MLSSASDRTDLFEVLAPPCVIVWGLLFVLARRRIGRTYWLRLPDYIKRGRSTDYFVDWVTFVGAMFIIFGIMLAGYVYLHL